MIVTIYINIVVVIDDTKNKRENTQLKLPNNRLSQIVSNKLQTYIIFL